MKMSQPIRIGIAGIGRAGWGMHCEELKGKEELFRIQAACDILEDRREKMRERYGCKAYARIEDLIRDPDVELVDIATRSCDHYRHAMMALEAGKDVLLEKPMCRTYQEALALKEAGSRPGGPRLFIRHNRRFEVQFQAILKLMDNDRIGDIFEIKITRNSFQFRDDWQTIREFGGGQLLNWGPHIIDQSLRLLGSPVARMFSDLKHVAAGGDCEDHIKILFQGENGRLVDMEISGGAAAKSPEYLVYGTRGSMAANGAERTIRFIDPEQQLPEIHSDPGTPGATFGSAVARAADGSPIRWLEETADNSAEDLTVIWRHLYAAVREGQPYPISLDEAVSVMEVVSRVKEGTCFA